jgi:dihydrofolate reductase
MGPVREAESHWILANSARAGNLLRRACPMPAASYRMVAMKLILYMASTVNGFIATEEGDSSWTTLVNEQHFAAMRKKTGVVIIGRATYDALVEAKEFPFSDCLNVVMAREAPSAGALKNVVFTDQSPEEVLEDLAKQGFEEALLAGGGELNGSFMADGLIDEIYLTLEPLTFGDGIKLFGFAGFRRDLELLDVEKISDGEVQLHYAVRRTTLEDYIGE